LIGKGIALEVCGRQTTPLPRDWVNLVAPLLDDKELPRRSRENAALGFLRSLDRHSPSAVEVLRAYVAQTGRKRALEKLLQIEQRFGQTPALDQVSNEIQDEIRMSCPRCATEMRKKDMVQHLWDEHRLVLDGVRVREPWRVIEDWVVDYGLEKENQVLQRCRELALRDDPRMGLARLQRLLYRHGLRDRELLNELRAQVRSQHATLCPHCCALVEVEDAEAAVKPLSLDGTILEGYGYSLEASEGGMLPVLEIESPREIVYQGREPGRGLTRLGTILLLCGPLIVATYAAVDWSTRREYPAPAVWGLAVGLGLLLAGLLYVIWPSPRPVRERLVKAAWKLLVPEMLDDKMDRNAWGFLTGLARLTEATPRVALNHDLLLECCEQASAAAAADPLARTCLASLGHCYLTAVRQRRGDPCSFLLRLAADCFKGKFPLTLLSDLLANFFGREGAQWPKSDLHRLPILLADLAFQTDVDLEDWLNLGRAFPVLNSVLGLEQRWHWQQFHALWSQREQQPWAKVGEAVTMIDMAAEPSDYDDILTYYPDVLLYVESANLVIASKGVWLEGMCITSFAPGTEVTAERTSGGWALHVGYVHIRCTEDLGPYLDDIEDWLRWYFERFVPNVPRTARPMTESRHRMWQIGKIICSECQRPLVPCLGDLGVTVR
jgi:hypothetical protein